MDTPDLAKKQQAGAAVQKVVVEVESDGVISYASYQNHIPAVHSISIVNETETDLRDVEVVVSCEPAFADSLRFRYEIISAGERRTIPSVPFKLRHQYLAGLNEEEKGYVRVQVIACGEPVTEADAPITVLAFDQWGGTRSVPELLAAFCAPNHPHVDRLIAEASEMLRGKANASMNGYESKSREAVGAQISAIFAAIARKRLQYALPPASFATDGQKVRTPDRILAGGVATCLDLTMLMASCLEQAGLNPLIFVQDGHAWVGCWLVNTSFSTSLTDDPVDVRKRIDHGEMLAIESTVLTHEHPSLARATSAGYKYFEGEAPDFRFAIDVRRARLERITPLPSRDAAALPERQVAKAEITIESLPPLPPLITEPVLLDEDPTPESPEGRLRRWQSKLLDLTLRNRLLNFKPSKVMVQLCIPDPAHLEDTLSDGQEWKFKPRPDLMEGADPRSRRLAIERGGEDPVEQMARDAMARHELLVSATKDKLDKSLYEIYLSVKNAQEETGANTLFLALGFLRWAEDERAEKSYVAPILLIPVTLKRASTRSGFSIVRHDDESFVNPTLLQALREHHEIFIKGVEPPPTDGHGVDVEKVFAIFREAVLRMPRWEVVRDVYLGVFSFHKFVMYSDLRLREADLRRNPIVSHLIDKPRESMGGENLSEWRDLDETHGPGELLAPLPADSSQLNALRRADQGHSFVLQGPPGTGKSQTITNLIANALAKGKTVLFVSEKMAALSVVERRLASIGLGPFCLQLHSNKAVKTEFLRQLRTSLEISEARSPAAWDREVERLTRLRNELNGLVRALHKEHPNGLTVRRALDTAIKYRYWQPIKLSLPEGVDLDARALDELREKARQMREVASELGELAAPPMRPLRHTAWSNAWEEELLESAATLVQAIARLRATALTLEQALGLDLKAPSVKLMADVDALAEVLLQVSAVPASFARVADDAAARRRLAELRAHGERRNVTWKALEIALKPEVARLQAVELQDAWAIASSKWFLPRWFGQRAVASRFIPYTLTGKAPPLQEIPELIERLRTLNLEDEALRVLDSSARDMLGETYNVDQTDWLETQRYEMWGARLEAALNRFADPDRPDARETLARCIRMLVSDQRTLLVGDGALAQRLVAYRAAFRMFNEALGVVARQAANDALLGDDPTNQHALDLLESALAAWKVHRSSIRTWCLWNELRVQAARFGIAEVFAAIERGAVKSSMVAEYVEFCYQSWWLKRVMDRDDALRTFSGAVHMQKIRDFQEADARFQELTHELIVARLAASLPGASQRTGPEFGALRRELGLQRPRKAIRTMVKAMPTLLPRLKPCLMMSPLSVAQYLDPAHPPFDLVIFDEASQIPVWDAVGVIARGKQVIIVGDPKQLPPTAFFDRGEDDESAMDQTEAAPPQDMQSILDECMAAGMSQLSLLWHYRSAHESLIAFSNARYYGSDLITFPSPSTQDKAVRLHQVNGIYDRGRSQTNRAEAEAVVNRIVEHFSQDAQNARALTIGVVTFNSK